MENLSIQLLMFKVSVLLSLFAFTGIIVSTLVYLFILKKWQDKFEDCNLKMKVLIYTCHIIYLACIVFRISLLLIYDKLFTSLLRNNYFELISTSIFSAYKMYEVRGLILVIVFYYGMRLYSKKLCMDKNSSAV